MNICTYTPTKYLDDKGYNERLKFLFKNVCYLLGKSSGTINLFDATITFAVNADPNTPGTTFDPNTPSLENVVYVSTIDNSLWTYNGVAYVSYVPPYWSKLGNVGTDPLINFIGTVDGQDLVIKTNNTEIARFSGDDFYRVAIGGASATGQYSMALGSGADASGESSLALGYAIASGTGSVAMGSQAEATDTFSTAIGENVTASAENATAIGRNSTASNVNSMALGNATVASGDTATSMGYQTTASGDYSTSVGYNTSASAIHTTAIGKDSQATGDRSTAIGDMLISKSYGGFVIGSYNDDTAPASAVSANRLNRVFEVGIGWGGAVVVGNIAPNANAITTLFNGNTGFMTTTPQTTVHIKGSFAVQQGSSKLSASTLSFGVNVSGYLLDSSNSFEVTGSNTINLLSNIGFIDGYEITLMFSGAATLTHGAATSGTDITMKLAGGVDFVASADDILTLILGTVGGVQAWREKCRSVN